MKIKGTYILTAFFMIALMVFLADDTFAQCSMCRKIATDGANTKSVGAGLNSGILYLLAIPYVLLALFFRKQILGFLSALKVKK